MRHVLAVTDLSPQAEPALRLAARVARDAGAALHVVHAMGLVGLTLREAFEPLSSGLIPRSEAALEEQVRRTVPPAAGPASCVLDYRDLPRAVAERHERHAPDLVVLGDRRSDLGPESRLAAAAELCTAASAPILVPSMDASWPPARIHWSSLGDDAGGVVTWLRRLAPVVTVVARGGSPRGRMGGPIHGEPDLLAVRAAERGPAWEGAGLERASILLLPAAEGARGGSGGEERVGEPVAAPPAAGA